MPFPITCTACQKTFSIADDVYERKVKGRIVTIKCKQCQAGIRVDGSKGMAPSRASDSAESSAPPMVAPPVAATELPATELPAAEPALVEAAALAASIATPAQVAPAVDAAAVATATKEPPPTAAAPISTVTKSDTPIAIAKAAASVPLATKAASVPLATKAASVPLATKAASVPLATKAASVPLATKAASVPLATKAASVPLATKAASVATTRQAAALVPVPNGAPLATPIRTAQVPAVTKSALPTNALNTAPIAMAKATPAVEPESTALAATPKVPTASIPKAATDAVSAKVATTAVAPAISATPAATPPSPVEPAPIVSAEATETLWAVEYPDGADRELTLTEIAKELLAATVSASSLVWREGMAEWQELGQVPELRALTEQPKPLPPRQAVPPPVRPQAPSAPTLDPQNLASTPALPKPRPPAPSAPVSEFAPFGTEPIPPPRARQPTISGIGEPEPITLPTSAFPIASAKGFPPAPVMVPAPALAAPFATPIQPFGQASAPARALAEAGVVAEWPQKSRAPLIIAGLVLLAVAAAIYFVMSSADDKLPPPAPIGALPATPPTAPPSAAGADRPSSSQEGPGSRAALEPPGSTPTTTPNAGFAELFASGARHADAKKGDVGPTQHFDQVTAKAALATAATETVKCREPAGPAGRATVVVTFDPSGKVSSATVSDPPFAGTSSGACIAAAMKRATVPAFSGLPGTVTKIVSIQ